MTGSKVILPTEFDGYSVVVSRFEKSLQKFAELEFCQTTGLNVFGQREIAYGHPDYPRGVLSAVRERRHFSSFGSVPIPEVILHRAWRNAGLDRAEVEGGIVTRTGSFTAESPADRLILTDRCCD